MAMEIDDNTLMCFHQVHGLDGITAVYKHALSNIMLSGIVPHLFMPFPPSLAL